MIKNNTKGGKMRKITSAIIIFFSFSAFTPAYARDDKRIDIDIDHETRRTETGIDKYVGKSLLIVAGVFAFGYFINSIANVFRGPETEKVIIVNPNQNNPYDPNSYSTINPQTKSGSENNDGKRILVNRKNGENTIPAETKPAKNPDNFPNVLPRF